MSRVNTGLMPMSISQLLRLHRDLNTHDTKLMSLEAGILPWNSMHIKLLVKSCKIKKRASRLKRSKKPVELSFDQLFED
ncbi:hypothetical protein P9112_012367 [Eukaryota sp. TZLM1-RC]